VQAEHGDLLLLDAAEGYHNLWRKVRTPCGIYQAVSEWQWLILSWVMPQLPNHHMVCALQALISLQVLEQRYQYDFYMHADDDSYVRLDLMLQLLVRTTLRIAWPACRIAQHLISRTTYCATRS
jgi:hypothetical protein